MKRGWMPARGARPMGPFEFNRGSAHALGLVGWYPIDALASGSALAGVIRERVFDRFSMVFQRTSLATFGWDYYGRYLLGTGTQGLDGTYFLDSLWNDVTTASNATIACWVYIPDTVRSGAFFKVGGGTTGFAIGVGDVNVLSDGNNICGLYENQRHIATNVPYGTGWHHVVMTLDGSGFPEMFLDGKSVYSDSGGAPTAPTAGLFVFYDTGNGLTPVGCGMADARVWNRRLSPAEIWSLYDFTMRWDLYLVPARRRAVKIPVSSALTAAQQIGIFDQQLAGQMVGMVYQ